MSLSVEVYFGWETPKKIIIPYTQNHDPIYLWKHSDGSIYINPSGWLFLTIIENHVMKGIYKVHQISNLTPPGNALMQGKPVFINDTTLEWHIDNQAFYRGSLAPQFQHIEPQPLLQMRNNGRHKWIDSSYRVYDEYEFVPPGPSGVRLEGYVHNPTDSQFIYPLTGPGLLSYSNRQDPSGNQLPIDFNGATGPAGENRQDPHASGFHGATGVKQVLHAPNIPFHVEPELQTSPKETIEAVEAAVSSANERIERAAAAAASGSAAPANDKPEDSSL